MRTAQLLIVLLVSATFCAQGAQKVIAPGQTLTLSEDLVLSGDDVLELNGTAENRCRLVGNNKQIRTKDRWTGRIVIQHCEIKGLGAWAGVKDNQLAPAQHALEVRMAGKAQFTCENSSFDACSSIHVEVSEEAGVLFRFNHVYDNALVSTHARAELSRPFFTAAGHSQPRKHFAGNLVLKSGVAIDGNQWMVGGDQDRESNLIIGPRANISVNGDNTNVRGNYVHVLMPPPDQGPRAAYWSQTSAVSIGRETVAEQNVFRGGHNVALEIAGTFRSNLVLDADGYHWIKTGSRGRIHNNILAGGSALSGIDVHAPPQGGADGAEIFNNVFDGQGQAAFPALTVAERCVVKSLRNNVFVNFAAGPMVCSAWNEKALEDRPARLGYADYNLFFTPQAPAKHHYALSVAGKTERKDAGFSLHDLPKGGGVNAQADPKFKGPLPERFPFSDEEIKARKVGVSRMLSFYKEAYTPGEDSPLIDAGDPADTEGTDVGAVDAGKTTKARQTFNTIKAK